MENTPISNEVEVKNEKLHQFIEKWKHDDLLQTFESREKFRKEAEELLVYNVKLTGRGLES